MKLLEYLNGKKTIIGVVASAGVAYLAAKGYIDSEMTTLLGTLSGLIFTVGVGHKINKAKKED